MNNLDIRSCINTLGIYPFRFIAEADDTPKYELSYQLSTNKFYSTLADAAYNNILVLNMIQIKEATDKETPTLFTLFDVTVSMLQCLPLADFIDKFGPSMGIEREQSTRTSGFIKNHGLDRPLDKDILTVIRNCQDSSVVFDFFDSLMRIAASMVRLSGQQNSYNDYRIKHNIQAELDCEECACVGERLDCDNCKEGYLYNYATGKIFKMQKTYGEYRQDMRLYGENWLNIEKHFKLPF